LKQILRYLSEFFKDYPHVGFWLGWIFFLIIGISLHYVGVYDPHFTGYSYPFWGQLFFYAVPYFFSIGWWLVWYGDLKILLKPGFWALSFLILLALYLNKFAHFYENYLPAIEDGRFWLQKTYFNLHSTFFYLLIPLIYGIYTKEITPTRFYGCTARNFNISPYLWMLVIMLPLLIWASFQPNFWVKYPRYRPGYWEMVSGVSPWFSVGIYELTYILQFVGLEIFFRGFVVMALGKYMGKASVFPMVAMYAFMHFYKPLAETIGSVFGGFILGGVAWKSRSVLGGMIVHTGIAMMMELLAFLQLYVRNLL